MHGSHFRILDDIRLDLGYTARTLLRTPGFAVAVLSLGLAVGATTAVYATADWLLDRSARGVVEPERLVGLWQAERGHTEEWQRYGFSYPQYLELSRIQDAFVDVAAFAKLVRPFGTDGWDDEIVQAFATGTYFPLLGVRPHLGRLIGPEDDLDGAAPLVVLSHAFWQSHFAGDPNVVGTPIRIGADPGRVIGVLPPEFEGYSLDWGGPTQVWLPMRSAQTLAGMAGMLTMTQTFFRIVGRMPSGVNAEVARERVQRVLPELPALTAPRFESAEIVTRPEEEMRIGRRPEAASFLGGLLLVCVLVLFAAFSNVANFLLGKGALRRREMALRAALGASRARLLRQVLTEASVLALAAGAASVLLGLGLTLLLAPLPQIYLQVPLWGTALTTAGAFDLRMVGVAVALCWAASLFAGILPMLGTFHDPSSTLDRSTSPWSWSRLRLSPRQCVLALQVGLAVSLAITATLFARTFQHASTVDAGFLDPESILMARLVTIGLDSEEVERFYHDLFERLDAAPGALSAAVAYHAPFVTGRSMVSTPEAADTPFEVPSGTASPRFFETLGIEMSAGRELTWLEDDADAVIINEQLAGRLGPGADPLGRTLVRGGESWRIVGVVDQPRCRDLLAEPSPCLWTRVALGVSSGSGTRTARIRTVGPALGFLPGLRAMVRELSPDVAVLQGQSLAAFLARRTQAERTTATASSGLALFGIVLLAIGCASLFVSMVRESVRELAIRITLGATSARVTAHVTAQGLLILAAGAAVGVVTARLTAGGLADRLYGVGPTDLMSYVSGLVLVLIVGTGAVAYAALEATRTAPAEHLRGD